MEKPKGVDIWDGIKLERDESLSEEDKKKLLEKTKSNIEELSKKIKQQNGK
ncbi:MAG: hypothetical protein IJ141_03405 [Lachnospiraceae bacterium]|nr:hypothetical protein [Lachnospiraceae bacterium]